MIDVSPDAPEMDLYQNSYAIAYRLGFGMITSYVPVDPGASTMTATLSGSKRAVTRSRTTLATQGQYTVLIGNFSDNLQQTVLKDQDTPAPAGKIAVRMIDESMLEGALDIYLVPAGQRISDTKPVISGSSFGANTGYVDLQAGTYSLVVEPAGAVLSDGRDALYTGAQIAYPSGAASTIILSDGRAPYGVPSLQVIVASDYVPIPERSELRIK
ncbi:DUF4397 domain-containing protein [Edaphobacter sp. HDX4]|uniref:DUF4397 domain-containing protein n=1 Tax=Edaphobacter sp. HDX4 TaxID=2794064 RepID=UPI002FE5025D